MRQVGHFAPGNDGSLPVDSRYGKILKPLGRELPILETEWMRLFPVTDLRMQSWIDTEQGPEMKQAYTEMFRDCRAHLKQCKWNRVWLMELRNLSGTIAGDFCFKGLGADGMAEIGCGLKDGWCHPGYMTEAVRAVSRWALEQPGVMRVDTEAAEENNASRNFLPRAVCGLPAKQRGGDPVHPHD